MESMCKINSLDTILCECMITNGGIGWCSMSLIHQGEKGCVVCKKQMNWYCPTCDDTIVCFGACFVK